MPKWYAAWIIKRYDRKPKFVVSERYAKRLFKAYDIYRGENSLYLDKEKNK